MKKVFLIIAVFCLVLPAQAQWGKRVKGNGDVKTETRNVGEYDAINVAGSFNVTLVAGDEGAITVKAEGNLMEYIITEVDGDNLKIKIEKGVYLKSTIRDGILITVPFRDIEEVNLAGSGDVVSKDIIKSANFETAVAGSGDMILEVEADRVEAAVAGSGDLTLTGKARSLEAKVAGSGDIHAQDFKSQDVDASVAGSGDIELYCDGGNLKARISGSGGIKYAGNVSKQDVKVSGSGNVSSM